MLSILISVASAIVVVLVWGLGQLPGGWGLGIFLGLLLMVGLWIFLARRIRRQIEPAFKQVQRLAEAGKASAAIETLEGILPMGRWMPMLSGQIRAQIGVFAHQMGDRPKAISNLEKASKRTAEGQMLLAAIHVQNGELERAKSVLRKALPYNRRSAMLYHVYAWVLLKDGDSAAAISALNLFLAKEKDDATTKKNLLRLQNGNKLNMSTFGMPWYALGLERPPQSMGQMQQARKGFRQPPKSRGKRKR